MDINKATDQEVIHAIEKKFGRDISHIAPAPYNERKPGEKQFTCMDIGVEALLSVDDEGYVKTKLVTSKYWDVLGSL